MCRRRPRRLHGLLPKLAFPCCDVKPVSPSGTHALFFRFTPLRQRLLGPVRMTYNMSLSQVKYHPARQQQGVASGWGHRRRRPARRPTRQCFTDDPFDEHLHLTLFGHGLRTERDQTCKTLSGATDAGTPRRCEPFLGILAHLRMKLPAFRSNLIALPLAESQRVRFTVIDKLPTYDYDGWSLQCPANLPPRDGYVSPPGGINARNVHRGIGPKMRSQRKQRSESPQNRPAVPATRIQPALHAVHII